MSSHHILCIPVFVYHCEADGTFRYHFFPCDLPGFFAGIKFISLPHLFLLSAHTYLLCLPDTGHIFPLSLTSPYRKPIAQFFLYYINLNDVNRKLFDRRAAHFIATKTFEARHMAAVTNDMKALIAACALQITFGITRYLFKDLGIMYVMVILIIL